MVIHKIKIQSHSKRQVFQIPKGYKILCLQSHRFMPCLWILIDPKEPLEEASFQVYETGWEDTPSEGYLGTWQEAGGSFVWHLFQILS